MSGERVAKSTETDKAVTLRDPSPKEISEVLSKASKTIDLEAVAGFEEKKALINRLDGCLFNGDKCGGIVTADYRGPLTAVIRSSLTFTKVLNHLLDNTGFKNLDPTLRDTVLLAIAEKAKVAEGSLGTNRQKAALEDLSGFTGRLTRLINVPEFKIASDHMIDDHALSAQGCDISRMARDAILDFFKLGTKIEQVAFIQALDRGLPLEKRPATLQNNPKIND